MLRVFAYLLGIVGGILCGYIAALLLGFGLAVAGINVLHPSFLFIMCLIFAVCGYRTVGKFFDDMKHKRAEAG